MSGKMQIKKKSQVPQTPASAGLLQRRTANEHEPETVPPIVHEVLRSPGQPLEEEARAFFEPRFGHDFSHVRVHTDAKAAESARAVNALAYTFGRDVVFCAGQYAPRTNTGTQLLKHELAHVVQQTGPDPIAPQVQFRSRAAEMDDLLEWWDSSSDAIQALNLLCGMSTTDFNDTISEMVRSGRIIRFVHQLPDRAGIVRFLKLLADQGTQANKEAVMDSDPMFSLGPENQMIVFGRRFAGSFGMAGPTPSSALHSSLVSNDPSAPFTGSGATGLRSDQSPMSLGEMRNLRSQSRAAVERFGSGGIERAQYSREPGLEMLYDWSNPIKGSLVGAGSYLDSLTPAQRQGQVQLLLNQQICTNAPSAYPVGLPTRAQVIRAAAAQHNLSPELVAAIILAEQRDQSKREDAADYRGATMGGRSTSIGLGQITVRTARVQNLFADVVSPSMQRSLALGTDMTNGMIASLLASDDFNIYAVARYLRIIADLGATKNIGTMPNTNTWVGAIDLKIYSQHSSAWSEKHIMLIGSEYTSKPFDDVLVTGWGEFVLEAYRDIKASGIF